MWLTSNQRTDGGFVTKLHRGQITRKIPWKTCDLCCLTPFRAPFLNAGFDSVANNTDFLKLLLFVACDTRWVGETPVVTSRESGKDRAALTACLVTDGNDMAEQPADFKKIQDALSSLG